MYAPKHVFKDGQKSTTTANIPFFWSSICYTDVLLIELCIGYTYFFEVFSILSIVLRSLLSPEPGDRDHCKGAPERHGHHSEFGSPVDH